MPAVHFNVRWPDGQEQQCYSPSTIIKDYFSEGDAVTVSEFLSRCEDALNLASRRVAEKYGYACSSAADQLQRIQQLGASFDDPNGQVTVLSIHTLSAGS